MTFNEVKTVVAVLEKYGNEKGVKFAIKRNKILKLSKAELTDIEQPKQEFINNTTDFREYLQEEYKLYTKFGGVAEDGKQVGISKEDVEPFMTELTALQDTEKYKIVLEQYKKIDDDTKALLSNESTIELPRFEIDELPEAITGNDLEVLQKLINE